MLYNNDFLDSLDMTFKNYFERSDAVRQSTFQDFATFYFNDYLGICDILKRDTLDNPFTAETLRTLQFQHINIITKVLNRLCSGIYTTPPARYLEIPDEKKYNIENEKFKKLLDELKYNAKVKESFRRAKYFNTVYVMPVYDVKTKKMRIDIYNPNDFKVKTQDDYNEIKSIAIRKSDPNGMIYYSIWTETEHFKLSGGKKEAFENNPKMKNPFSPEIPGSVLRMKEGIDFYGEPNWNLFLNQKYFDIRLTDFDKTELNTIWQTWIGLNTNFKKDETFRPNEIKQINGITNEDFPPSLQAISANIDYTAIKENIDWKLKTAMNSEGLSSNTINTEVIEVSGISKLIDELELQEQREEDKDTLKYFEISLMNDIRQVYNYYSEDKIDETSKICIEFSNEKQYEPVNDKKTRREMEVTYGYNNSVGFAMEDYDLTEKQAIQKIIDIAKQNELLESELLKIKQTDENTESGMSENEEINPEDSE